MSRIDHHVSSDSIQALGKSPDGYATSLGIEVDVEVNVIQQQQPDPLLFIPWCEEQRQDPALRQVITVLQGAKPPKHLLPMALRLLRQRKQLQITDDVLWRHTATHQQLVVPSHRRQEAKQRLHDNMGHLGRNRVTALASERIYWPGYHRDLEDYIKQCPRCLRAKHRNQNPVAPLHPITSTYPMELVCIDYLSLDPCKGKFENVLVVTDHFTNYAQAYVTKNQTALTTAKVLVDQFIPHYGMPTRLHSDQGKNFESALIKELCKLYNTTKSRTTPYHPMGDGKTERFNSTLMDMIRTLEPIAKQDWKVYLPQLCHAYNSTVHASTGYSPFYLMFGRRPRIPIDVVWNLPDPSPPTKGSSEYGKNLQQRLRNVYDIIAKTRQHVSQQQKRRYDKRVAGAALHVGDFVLVRRQGFTQRHKLQDYWEEQPSEVIAQPNPSIPVYKVKQVGTKLVRTLHRNQLRLVQWPPVEQLPKPSKLRPTSQAPVPIPAEEDPEVEQGFYDFWHEPGMEPEFFPGGMPMDDVDNAIPQEAEDEAEPVLLPDEPVSPQPSQRADDEEPSTPGSQRVDSEVESEGSEGTESGTEDGAQAPLEPDFRAPDRNRVSPLRRGTRVRHAPDRYTPSAYTDRQQVGMLQAVHVLLSQYPQLTQCLHPHLLGMVWAGVKKWKDPFQTGGDACEGVNLAWSQRSEYDPRAMLNHPPDCNRGLGNFTV